MLIFSQMTRMLDILEDYLSLRQFPFERLDGGVRGFDRQSAIDRFMDAASDWAVFLISTRAEAGSLPSRTRSLSTTPIGIPRTTFGDGALPSYRTGQKVVVYDFLRAARTRRPCSGRIAQARS